MNTSTKLGIKLRRKLGACRLTDIDNSRNIDAVGSQVCCRCISTIVICGNRHSLPRHDRKLIEVLVRCGRHHHTRPVIAIHHQGPLNSTSCIDDRLRRYKPKPLLRQILNRFGHVITHALNRAEGQAIISAENRGAGQDTDVWHGFECCGDPSSPFARRLIVDLVTVPKALPAQLGIFIGQDHFFSCLSQSPSGGQTSRTSPHHQHIAMAMHFAVVIGVTLIAGFAQSRSTPNKRLVKVVPPAFMWPHERLVIKAGRKETTNPVVDAEDIKPQRRPAILADSLKSVVQLLHGCPRVWLAPSTTAYGHQCVRLFTASGHDSTGTVIFE